MADVAVPAIATATPTESDSVVGVVQGGAVKRFPASNFAFTNATVADYTALRAFTGTSKTVYVTGYLGSAAPSGIAGHFTVDDSDTTSSDNSGTIIVASNGKRWKRVYDGRISVRWFEGLAVAASAQNPGDPNSYLLANFTNWSAAINAALDVAYGSGGGEVVIPKHTQTYYVRERLQVRDKTTLIFEDWVVLADYNANGHTLELNGPEITVINPMIDNSSIYAGGSGYNGIWARTGGATKILGGHVKNCARGGVAPNDGGKGVQAENGNASDITVLGTTFENCFMAMSAHRSYTTVGAYKGVIFNGVTAYDCDILLFVHQTSGAQVQTGVEHAVQLTNFYARNCGAHQGVLQFSRASNVLVSQGQVVNEAITTPLIRGNHANCQFLGIGFYGNATSVIDLEPGDYSVDTSQANQHNRYDIQVWGQVGYLATSNVAYANRTLNSCFGSFQCRLDPTTAWFGAELRNGLSTFHLVQGTKTFHAVTLLNYEGVSNNPAKFSDLTASRAKAQYHALRFGNVDSSDARELDWYEEGTWTPVFDAEAGSGGTATTSGTYTRVGRQVTVHGLVTVTGLGTFANRVRISGLPFAWTGDITFGDCYISAATLPTACNVAAAVGVIGSYVTFWWTSNAGGAGDNVRIADITAASIFRFSVTYNAA